MKIEGLFLDYDGTISSLNMTREESNVPLETQAALSQITRLIPVGIISTKDLAFIVPRTPFARAWCAVAGLEIRIGQEITRAPGLEKMLPRLMLALKYIRQCMKDDVIIEEKRDSNGQTLAFCVDWRLAENTPELKNRVTQVMACCEALNLAVVKYEGQPFFDVYPCPVNKGQALENLKKSFALSSGVLYMGDSPVDNTAFKASDISIGVFHRESVSNLDCHYWIRFEEVARFLQFLLEKQLVFSTDLPLIKIRK